MNDTLEKDLKEIEAQLSDLKPSQMPADMLSRMEQAMSSSVAAIPEETEKIVPFDPINTNKPSSSNTQISSKLNLWSAAAAVALMGCVAGVFMTSNSPEHPVTAKNPAPAYSSKIPITNITPRSASPEFSRNITHASNEGITYAGKNDAPFQVLRIEYTEKIVTEDTNGNAVITKKPCIEHVLVPIPVH